MLIHNLRMFALLWTQVEPANVSALGHLPLTVAGRVDFWVRLLVLCRAIQDYELEIPMEIMLIFALQIAMLEDQAWVQMSAIASLGKMNAPLRCHGKEPPLFRLHSIITGYWIYLNINRRFLSIVHQYWYYCMPQTNTMAAWWKKLCSLWHTLKSLQIVKLKCMSWHPSFNLLSKSSKCGLQQISNVPRTEWVKLHWLSQLISFPEIIPGWGLDICDLDVNPGWPAVRVLFRWSGDMSSLLPFSMLPLTSLPSLSLDWSIPNGKVVQWRLMSVYCTNSNHFKTI